MDESLEARVERLENFIGNIDQIRLYANSLQEVIDNYLAPLYIESGATNVMLVDGYLGDLDNIPHNVIFKIRASHNLEMVQGEQAKLVFKRADETQEYTLRKNDDGTLVPLANNNYLNGETYDIYINSQDVAILTASDIGARAMARVEALENQEAADVLALSGTITDNYNTLSSSITSSLNAAKTYTDTNVGATNTRVGTLENKTAGMSRTGTALTIIDSVNVTDLSVANLTTTNSVTMTGTQGFVLPSGTTIADPNAALGLANKQWVETYVGNSISDYHANFHYVGTADAETAMAGKDNGSFYYKLSQ